MTDSRVHRIWSWLNLVSDFIGWGTFYYQCIDSLRFLLNMNWVIVAEIANSEKETCLRHGSWEHFWLCWFQRAVWWLTEGLDESELWVSSLCRNLQYVLLEHSLLVHLKSVMYKCRMALFWLNYCLWRRKGKAPQLSAESWPWGNS